MPDLGELTCVPVRRPFPGELPRVPVHRAFSGEARDFTSSLARPENLVLIGTALSIEAGVEATGGKGHT